MPRLSDSMEEGTIVRWLVSEGDAVSRGEEIVEIETDKATMAYAADSAGVISFVASEGDTLPIGSLIARLNGSDSAAPKGAEEDSPAPVKTHPAAPSAGEPSSAPLSTAPAPERPAPAPSPGSDGNGRGRVKASPLARRLARDQGVDLSSVSGSGPGGRIVKADIEAAASGAAPAPPVTPSPAAPPSPAPAPAGDVSGAKGEVSVVELSRAQQVIARRMAESRATVPDFTLAVDVDVEQAWAGREALKATAGEGAVVPSINDLVVKACAVALRELPRANGAYRDGRFELYSRVNVGVAVAVPEGLVVPTIFDADGKTLGEIARESRELAGKVRDGTITPPELSGATFTVSNLGMYGVREFVAVINPPQAAILSVGAVEERPVVRDGAVVPGRRMSVSLACDHRILYGADAAQFLARVRALLEAPLGLA